MSSGAGLAGGSTTYMGMLGVVESVAVESAAVAFV